MGAAALIVLAGCATTGTDEIPEAARRDPSALLVVDCLLPSRVRQLGARLTYLEPRRAIRTSASECGIRGGEYTAYDRANFATALEIWLPRARDGDPEAQTYVGEIHEKGLGVTADYESAASWYRRAAEQGHSRAQMNLGYLHETGLGVPRDLVTAMNHYRDASGLTDGDLEYVSSLEYAERETARERGRELEMRVKDLLTELARAEAHYAEQQRERVAESEAVMETLRASLAEARATDDAQDVSPPGADLLEPDAAAAERAALREALAAREQQIDEHERDRRQLLERIRALEANASPLPQERERLTAEFERTAAALEQARDEQRRLTSRLRDEQLDAARRATQDRTIISGLKAALGDGRRELERQVADAERLEDELVATRTALASAPDAADRAELQTEVAAKTLALEQARAEQQRLTARLRDEELDALTVRREADRRLAVLEGELADRERQLAEQRDRLRNLEDRLPGTTLAALDSPAIEDVAQVVATGPTIDITDPPLLLTRGTTALAVADASFDLVGSVQPAAELLAFRIGGEDQALDTSGAFRYRGEVDADSDATLELLAVDDRGESTRLSLQIVRAGTTLPDERTAGAATPSEPADPDPGAATGGRAAVPVDDIAFGRYHALVIGNDDYRELGDLETAVNDAREVERVLRERYGFETTLLLDATRIDVLAALDRLRETLTEDDNLLIYYAGHGAIDPDSGRGYWLPVDAEPSDTEAWIANAAITGLVDAIPAKHVLVIADSCFSGTMTPASVARPLPDMAPELRRRWLKAVTASRVRTALSSGGVRPVIDGTPGARHSIFAGAFIETLRRNGDVLEAYALYLDVQRDVSRIAQGLDLEQQPRYAPIRHAGHEAGEFVFVPTATRGAVYDPMSSPRSISATRASAYGLSTASADSVGL